MFLNGVPPSFQRKTRVFNLVDHPAHFFSRNVCWQSCRESKVGATGHFRKTTRLVFPMRKLSKKGVYRCESGQSKRADFRRCNLVNLLVFSFFLFFPSNYKIWSDFETNSRGGGPFCRLTRPRPLLQSTHYLTNYLSSILEWTIDQRLPHLHVSLIPSLTGHHHITSSVIWIIFANGQRAQH